MRTTRAATAARGEGDRSPDAAPDPLPIDDNPPAEKVGVTLLVLRSEPKLP